MINRTIYIEKKNIGKATVVDLERPKIEEGEVLLKINKFALTSNNITYAVIGFQMKYWDFFPAPEPQGIVPVWGFGEVAESNNPEIKVGEKVYGYFPMSQFTKLKAGKVNAQSFMAMDEHRQGLAPIYNTCNRLGMEINHKPELQDYIPIFQPLFATSFLNNQLLISKEYFGASRIILTSASSKTALALAYCLQANKAETGIKITGLTSTGNVNFVKKSELYDQVLSYDQVEDALANETCVIVDFAGNAELLSKLHKQLHEDLKFTSMIGLTNWNKASMKQKLSNTEFFFAPTYAQAFYKEHGPQKASELLFGSMFDFIQKASEWLEIEHLNDFETLRTKYLEILAGKVDPSKGYIIVNK